MNIIKRQHSLWRSIKYKSKEKRDFFSIYSLYSFEATFHIYHSLSQSTKYKSNTKLRFLVITKWKNGIKFVSSDFSHMWAIFTWILRKQNRWVTGWLPDPQLHRLPFGLGYQFVSEIIETHRILLNTLNLFSKKDHYVTRCVQQNVKEKYLALF